MSINENDKFEYYSSKGLPHLSLYRRVLFFLNKYSIIRRFGLQPLIRKELELPSNTRFSMGFKSISGQVQCGNQVSFQDAFLIDYAPIIIGDNVSFSYNNTLITSTHDLLNFDKVIAKPIVIEDNVWITTNVTILGGVRIGTNSVIGAGSVVVTSIPENVFACGNPCKPIKKIKRSF